MKRYLILALALLMAIGLVACSRDEVPPVEDNTSSTVPGEDDSSGEAPDELPIPADAALYRGEVTEIRTEGDAVTLVLRQVAGTDYGRESLEAVLDADTRTDFKVDEAVEGDYMAVYYGVDPSGGETPEQVSAIVMSKLPPAAECVVGGSLVEITKDAPDAASGSMRIDLGGDLGDVTVAYGDATQFYLNADDLAAGDRLSVLTDGTGEPPMALEVRRYAEQG